MLSRAAGIPARMAVGFLPGTADGPGGGRIVRVSDAHAWPELYFEGLGWVPFEPTPSRGSVPDYAADAVIPGGSGSNLDEDAIPIPNQTPQPNSSALPPAPLPGAGTGAGAGIPQAVFVLAGVLLAAALLARGVGKETGDEEATRSKGSWLKRSHCAGRPATQAESAEPVARTSLLTLLIS